METNNTNQPVTTCKDCEHRERWETGGRILQYCGVRPSRRTFNGLEKIRCKDKSCDKFKPISDSKTNTAEVEK